MNNKIILIIVALFFILNGCKENVDKLPEGEKYENTAKDSVVNDNSVLTTAGSNGEYFCPMHPEQQSNDSTAKCAICKMELTSKDEHADMMNKMHDQIVHKHEKNKNMGHFEVELSKINSDECAKIVEDALRKHSGVTDLFIDILEPRAHIMYDKSKTKKSEIELSVINAGFDANGKKADENAKNNLPVNCKN